MTRRLLALTAALSVAAAALAPVPARADENDLGKIIAGIAAIAIIGAAIENRNERRRAATVPEPLPYWRKILPANCLIDARGRDTYAMGSACLTETYADADRLPEACLIQVPSRGQGHRRERTGYELGCLFRNGYALDQ